MISMERSGRLDLNRAQNALPVSGNVSLHSIEVRRPIARDHFLRLLCACSLADKEHDFDTLARLELDGGAHGAARIETRADLSGER